MERTLLPFTGQQKENELLVNVYNGDGCGGLRGHILFPEHAHKGQTNLSVCLSCY